MGPHPTLPPIRLEPTDPVYRGVELLLRRLAESLRDREAPSSNNSCKVCGRDDADRAKERADDRAREEREAARQRE